ncbi:MAG: hypothetical protein H0V66_04785 [Bdellovibrionales bacterium]|nr:hypothetical protein [Bdellovibrionales bacterium]
MIRNDQSGFYLFQKSLGTDTALKEMLQFLRTGSPGRSLQFAYVEAETSLIPHLTLWENLHIVVGGSTWKEFVSHLEVDWQPLVKLIKDPEVVASEATPWERLTISLIKATLMKTPHVLVDINEAHYAPLNLSNFKKMLMLVAQQKNVFIATSNTTYWQDSSHSLVTRNGYEFVVEVLSQDQIKKPRTA